MSESALLAAGFWLSFLILVYTFVGYPILLMFLRRVRPGPLSLNLGPLTPSLSPSDGERVSEGRVRGNAVSRTVSNSEGNEVLSHTTPLAAPAVSVVLVAHNEQHRIVSRLQNLMASPYPSERLEFVVVSDGSTDNTVERIQQLGDPRVRVIAQPARSGKAHCLNAGIAAARGEIIVLADARQTFAPETIPQLVRHFAHPEIGAVSGALMIDPAASTIGTGVDAYWRLEKFIRESEARWDSCIGCTGAVCAIRRVLFQPVPDDSLVDDVLIPMQIALQGFRVGFDPAAAAFDPQPLEPDRERVRKRRTLAGNFQMLFRYPGWLLPWRNRLWWQLISHKYLRLSAPPLLLVLLVANAFLIDSPAYRVLMAGQCVFYTLALLGILFPKLRFQACSIPAGFVFLNLMTVAGFWHYLTGAHRGGWELTNKG